MGIFLFAHHKRVLHTLVAGGRVNAQPACTVIL